MTSYRLEIDDAALREVVAVLAHRVVEGRGGITSGLHDLGLTAEDLEHAPRIELWADLGSGGSSLRVRVDYGDPP